MRALVAALVAIVVLSACGDDDETPRSTVTPNAGSMALVTSGFEPGAMMDQNYTCDGQDISPPFDWSDGPPGTQSYAIELVDNDVDGRAPGSSERRSEKFVHWIAFDIPANVTILGAAINDDLFQMDGTRHAINSFSQANYRGPCPPDGETHQYVFTLYALDVATADPMEYGIGAGEIQAFLTDHAVASSVLPALYKRLPESERSITATPSFE